MSYRILDLGCWTRNFAIIQKLLGLHVHVYTTDASWYPRTEQRKTFLRKIIILRLTDCKIMCKQNGMCETVYPLLCIQLFLIHSIWNQVILTVLHHKVTKKNMLFVSHGFKEASKLLLKMNLERIRVNEFYQSVWKGRYSMVVSEVGSSRNTTQVVRTEIKATAPLIQKTSYRLCRSKRQSSDLPAPVSFITG